MPGDWQIWVGAALGLAGMAAALGMALYCRVQMNRMEEILARFAEKGEAGLSDIREQRESKLVSQMAHLLRRTEMEEKQASQERDQVTALLSDLSHQLKTPLANMVMYTELLEDPSLSEEEKTLFVRETRHQAEKMQWLMKNMLKASQLEQGILSFPSGYAGIKETIGKAVTAVYASAADKQIRVVTEEFADRRLYHNPKWTVEALGNILDNAVKYSPQGSVIAVRVRPLEIYTRIEIEDQGIGISPDHYNDIFKRFYRGQEVACQEGNGLGLYLAQLILNKEKGYITVAPGKEKGSCFQVFLLNEAQA